jgi:Holliday junction resolvasome RuvABC endonuclease subunit
MRTKYVIGIDPGVTKGFGYAVFKNRTLILAGMTKDLYKTCKDMDIEFEEAAIETPVVRPLKYQKGRQKDIVDLAIAAGKAQAIVTMFGHETDFCCITFSPETWKGQLPKKIACARVLAALSEEEKAVLPKKYTDDVLDAIGIAMHSADSARALR